MSEAKQERQPKIYQRMLLRFAIGLFVITALILGYRWFSGVGVDIGGLGTADTAGWIVATEHGEDGARVVVIKPNGDVLRTPEYRPGANEQEPIWRSDGNHVFFTSDRDKKSYNVFRWNLANNLVEQRTHGSFAYSAPSTSPIKNEDGDLTVLAASRGIAWDINPRLLQAEQVMPYEETSKASTTEEGEGGAAASPDVGASRYRIRKAKWGKDRQWIIAVRRLETDYQVGEALLIQPMFGDTKQRVPMPVAFGEHIDFDVNPNDGRVVFVVQGFQFPPPVDEVEAAERTANPPKKPYQNFIASFDPNNPREMALLDSSTDNKRAFAYPRISPDGGTLAVTSGAYKDDSVHPERLEVMPIAGGPLTPVVEGQVLEPSWHPNSKSFLFILIEEGKRNIYSLDQTGNRKRISDGKNSYSMPQYSPQSK